jgi:hypothetical protein
MGIVIVGDRHRELLEVSQIGQPSGRRADVLNRHDQGGDDPDQDRGPDTENDPLTPVAKPTEFGLRHGALPDRRPGLMMKSVAGTTPTAAEAREKGTP